MKKSKIIMLVILFLVIIAGGFGIYKLSDMTSSSSNDGSKSLITESIERILDITNEYEITNSHPDKAKLDYATHLLNKPMRKLMHFTEYFVLAIIIIIFINMLFNNKRYIMSLLITIALCFGYAYYDEYHQTKVEGRTGQFQDVVIDTSGAIFGTIVYGSYYLAYRAGRKSKEKEIEESKNKSNKSKP